MSFFWVSPVILRASGCPDFYGIYCPSISVIYLYNTYEPCHEKTCLRGFRPDKTQTGLLSYRSKLESWNFSYSKYSYYTIKGANNKGADQTAHRLIWAFIVGIGQKQVFSWRSRLIFELNGHKINKSVATSSLEYLNNQKQIYIWTASSEFGTYRLCEQRRFRRACASTQSRQNLRCSLIQAVSQEEPSDRKPDPWPLWMAGHAQLKFVMTECSKTQIRLTGLISY